MRWYLIIDPERYDDAEDNGYAWAGEADTLAEAHQMACDECNIDNDWDEGEPGDIVTPENAPIIDGGPDWKHYALAALEVLEAESITGGVTDELRAAKAVRL